MELERVLTALRLQSARNQEQNGNWKIPQILKTMYLSKINTEVKEVSREIFKNLN